MGERVLVCGSRSAKGKDREWVYYTLDSILSERGPIDLIIHGDAKGPSLNPNLSFDRLAMAWARRTEIPFAGCPARWGKYGKAAGPLRNQEMIEVWKPSLVVAFPGGRGTADMVRRAQRASCEVVEVTKGNAAPKSGESRSSAKNCSGALSGTSQDDSEQDKPCQ